MNTRRCVTMVFRLDVIEALGWQGFGAIADRAADVAFANGFPDDDTAAERLEYRHHTEAFGGEFIIASFEVMPA